MDSFTARVSDTKEKEIKKKARRYSILLLLLLLILLLMPWVNGELQTQKKYETVIMVDFEKEFTKAQASARRSSARKASAAAKPKTEEAPPPKETKPVEETQPKPEVKPVEKPVVKPKPTPAPIKLPNRKPVLSTTEPEVALNSYLKDISKNAQIKEVSEEVTEVTEEISEDFMKEISDYFKKNSKKSSTTGSGSTPNADGGSSSSANAGNPSDGGEGDSGSSDSGNANTDGQGDAGDAGPGTFDGNGLLTRKVIRRANVESIIKNTGKIVINLCVNQDGKVIFSKADKKESTITSRSILKRAEITAAKYRYEKDYTVAERQCGKLSFVVKIEK